MPLPEVCVRCAHGSPSIVVNDRKRTAPPAAVCGFRVTQDAECLIGSSAEFLAKAEMFSRQDAKNAKESMARFRPMTECGISWFTDDGLVFDKEIGPKVLFIRQPGVDRLVKGYGTADDLPSHLVLRHPDVFLSAFFARWPEQENRRWHDSPKPNRR